MTAAPSLEAAHRDIAEKVGWQPAAMTIYSSYDDNEDSNNLHASTQSKQNLMKKPTAETSDVS